ncbi:uncharacterized protein [Eurosta solidaginis]|uniref:uncharacterized protein n=1 Tax=Eurosta solidaginis TaxID=178769 RepID=UPI0035310079
MHGDYLSLLQVYNQWLDTDYSTQWCKIIFNIVYPFKEDLIEHQILIVVAGFTNRFYTTQTCSCHVSCSAYSSEMGEELGNEVGYSTNKIEREIEGHHPNSTG